MFSGPNAHRLDIVMDVRELPRRESGHESFDPHAAPQRPPVMTSEDYLRAREQKKTPFGEDERS